MSEFNNLTRATSFGAVVSSIPSDNWHYDLQKTHRVLGNLDDWLTLLMFLLLRRFGCFNHGSVLFAHHQDGEFGGAAHVVGVEAGVVELSS